MQVYRGRRKNTGLTVAIKTISKHGKSRTELDATWKEMEILAGLRHENIIGWIEAIDTEDNFIAVTEFGQGTHVSHILQAFLCAHRCP